MGKGGGGGISVNDGGANVSGGGGAASGRCVLTVAEVLRVVWNVKVVCETARLRENPTVEKMSGSNKRFAGVRELTLTL